MIRCPVCDSAHVLVVVSARRSARCSRCGATWIQDGAWQRAVVRPTPPAGGSRLLAATSAAEPAATVPPPERRP